MALSLNTPKLDDLAGDIWKSAERLRGKFKAYEYLSAGKKHGLPRTILAGHAVGAGAHDRTSRGRPVNRVNNSRIEGSATCANFREFKVKVDEAIAPPATPPDG